MPKIRLDRLKGPPPCRDEAEYKARLEKLQGRMLAVQQAYFHGKRRALIVFEGTDAAGKGGAIRRVTELLDPRGVRVWPIGPPTPEEQGKHYLYRFWTKLPAPGTIAIFDRSWYGRVLVERAEGLINRTEWKRAYDEITAFERMLIDDGARIVKLYLAISRKEQIERFLKRLEEPAKHWKLTDADIESHGHWNDYVAAAEDMFEHTSKKAAPWTVIDANKKWIARIQALETITEVLAKGVDLKPPPIDPDVARWGRAALKKLMAGAKKK
jgi:AMP-polyphosphate phosphotransferase